MRRRPRRWDLSPDELERVAAAQRDLPGPLATGRLVLRSPEVIPEVARVLIASGRQALIGNNALISLIDSLRARQAVPDAASGAGWYEERPFLDALLPRLTPTTTALELGCGGGRISRHVAPHVAELVCTDVSRAMVAEARANLAEYPNVRVDTTDGFALGELADASFDVVFAQGLLGYLDPNPALALLAEVRRVLRPGGLCAFNFGTIDRPDKARRLLTAVRQQARNRRFGGSIERAYTVAQLEAMYGVAGLKLIEAPGEGSAHPSSPGRIILVGRAEGEGPAEAGVVARGG